MKAVVVAGVVLCTPDYVRVATHYWFRPDFCHAKDPEIKGIVENVVNYAKADLMVPLGAVGQRITDLVNRTRQRGVQRGPDAQPLSRQTPPGPVERRCNAQAAGVRSARNVLV